MRKYNLLFDGSILTNEFSKNDARSGIFFMAKNIFNELLKREDINLFLYCDLSKLQALKEYVKKYNLNVEILNECEYNLLHKSKAYFRGKKSEYDKKTHPFKRNFWSIGYSIFSAINVLLSLFNVSIVLKKKLKNIDFYFSPNTKVPNVIKHTKNILSSVHLHDTIPFILPEYAYQLTKGNNWLKKTIK